MQKPVRVFCGYADEDEQLLDELEKHLAVYIREGSIDFWSRRNALPGTNLAEVVATKLASAHAILILMSTDSLSSESCNTEAEAALERHNSGEVTVIPVLIRACPWRNSLLGFLHLLPHNKKPVVEWDYRDAAWEHVVRSVTATLKKWPIALEEQSGDSGAHNNLSQRSRLLQSAVAIQKRQDYAPANSAFRIVPSLLLPDKHLPAKIPIDRVFDQQNGELLILGEPGGGKTTLLWSLAESLLQRAALDDHRRVPVVLDLSAWVNKQSDNAWANKRLPFTEWVTAEVADQYYVPSVDVDLADIILLLDGLDQVVEGRRDECVRRIKVAHGHSYPLVVCCRKSVYQKQWFRKYLSKGTIQEWGLPEMREYLRVCRN